MTIAMPFVALIRRELLTNLRRPWLFPCIGGVVLVCAVAAVYLSPTVSINDAVFLTAYETQEHYIQFSTELAMQVRRLLGTFFLIVLFGSALLVPGMAATSIAGERERETLGMLYMTCARPIAFLTAKLVNTVGVFLLLGLATMPILTVGVLLIGRGAEIAQTLALMLLVLMSCAAVGLFCGALCRSTAVGLAASYVATSITLGIPRLSAYVIMYVIPMAPSSVGRDGPFLFGFPNACPFGALEGLALGGIGTGQLKWAVGYQAAVAAVFFFGAWWLLRRHPAVWTVHQRKVIDDPAVIEARRKRFPYYILDPMRRKEPIPDGRNPMFVKELHGGLVMHGPFLLRLFCLAFACCFLLGFFMFYLPAQIGYRSDAGYVLRSATSLHWWLLILQTLIVVVSPGLIVNAFTKEYESHNMDLLRMTLLKPSAIVRGKLLAALIMISPVVLGALYAAVPVLIYHIPALEQWPLFVTGYATLFVSVLVVFAVTLVSALLTQRTTQALILAYVLNAAVFVAPVFAISAVAAVFPGIENPYRVGMFFSPVTAFAEAEALRTSSSVANAHWFSYWLGSMLLFIFLSIGLVLFSFRRFSTSGMQDR